MTTNAPPPHDARRPIRAVVQSRMSSSRLPGKALLPVAGTAMVVLVGRRLAGPDVDVVVATSNEPEDDAIEAAAVAGGLRCVRGPLDDTLQRFVVATADLDDDVLVARLTADNVLPDHALLAELADMMTERGVRYIRVGGLDAGVPYGVAAELFELSLLREALPTATSASDREHVTPALRRLAGDCQVDPADIEPSWGRLRCTVDTLHDYDTVWRLFEGVDEPDRIEWRELCRRLGDPPPPLGVRRPNPIDQGPLVLGTVQLGLQYGAANHRGMPSDTEAMGTLLAAVDLDISHLDTARAYGVSEARIGVALNRGLSERMNVVTKLLPLDHLPDDAPAGWVRAAFDVSVADSLKALKTEHVDALLLHRAADLHRGDGAVRDGLRALREAGIATVTGVSVQDPAELLDALADPECGYVQLPFNAVDDRWTAPAVTQALAARPDVIITVRSVFLQGLLVGGAASDWPRLPGLDAAEIQRISSTLERLAKEFERRNVTDLCLAYVLGHDWVTSVVIGAETADQVRESAELITHPPLTDEQCQEVRNRLHPVPADLLDPARWS